MPASPQLGTATWQNGLLQFNVNGVAGPDYIIETSSNLAAPNGWEALWTNLSPTPPFQFADLTTNGAAAVLSGAIGAVRMSSSHGFSRRKQEFLGFMAGVGVGGGLREQWIKRENQQKKCEKMIGGLEMVLPGPYLILAAKLRQKLFRKAH